MLGGSLKVQWKPCVYVGDGTPNKILFSLSRYDKAVGLKYKIHDNDDYDHDDDEDFDDDDNDNVNFKCIFSVCQGRPFEVTSNRVTCIGELQSWQPYYLSLIHI